MRATDNPESTVIDEVADAATVTNISLDIPRFVPDPENASSQDRDPSPDQTESPPPYSPFDTYDGIRQGSDIKETICDATILTENVNVINC